MFEFPEQADPTGHTEGPTDQPPKVPDQADPTDPTEGPTDQPSQQEQKRPTNPKMPSDDPTYQPPTVPPTVPPVVMTAASPSVFHLKVSTIGPKAFMHTSAKLAWVGTQMVLTILAAMDS